MTNKQTSKKTIHRKWTYGKYFPQITEAFLYPDGSLCLKEDAFKISLTPKQAKSLAKLLLENK